MNDVHAFLRAFASPLFVNPLAIALAFSDIESALKILVLLLTAIYTVQRIVKNYKFRNLPEKRKS